MRAVRSIASVAVAATVLAGLGALAATPASAADRGPLLPGNLYILANNVQGVAAATSADQVISGTYAPAPFLKYVVAADQPCPAGTATVNAFVRQATTGPEVTWEEWAFAGQKVVGTDAAGNSYLTGPFNSPKAAQIQQFLAANPSVTQLPLALVCYTSGGTALGRFETQIHLDANTTNDGTWALISPAILPDAPSEAVATTTTLSYTTAGANLQLTATVAPSSAAGSVTFFNGPTELGTVPASGGTASYTVVAPSPGVHSYGATFTPTDPAAYTSSSGTLDVTVDVAPDGTITVTLLVPEAPAEPGTVTLSVPSSASVNLNGQRDTGNTRITASGALPTVTVTDTHRDDLLTSWQVNIQAGDFTSSAGTISAKYLGLQPTTPSTVPTSGPATVVQAGPTVQSYLDDAASLGLSQAKVLGQVATPGRGVTTVGGTLNFAVEPTAPSGTYTSVITITLVGG